MKNTLLFLFALITFGYTNAQTKTKGTVEITPKIGYSSFAEVTDKGNTDSNSGFSAGVTGDYYFNNRWSLRSGLITYKMGGKYVFLNSNSEDKLNYLNIPVNANWHFGSTRKWNLNFGLCPSFLTNAKYVINGVENNIPKESINSFQLGLSYGIGYKIEVTKKFGILLDVQFFSGLTEIDKSSDKSFKNAGGGYNLGAVLQL